ncbi:TPA: DUF4422 domain-containing protein, partial [Campylobacter coli]|nr:DUF4422 domain-containing protein [Campylobacter coli]HED6603966.1 DUF4422 domain-containing protein [Campylobacter coli]
YKNNNDFHFVKISNNIPSFFNITKTSLEQICCNYDIIASNKIIVPGCFEKDYLNNFTQYEIYAKDHYISDLDIVIDIIRKKYPYYEKALQKILFTKGQHISWCNMFIMRKDLYFEYCAWLFDILFEAKQYIPYEIYDDYQKRVFGFLAERLFNVFIFHQKINKNITRKNIKICEKNVCCLKDKRPKFGWQTIDNKKRFYVLGIRILKQIIK